jgi:hypothetical protein
MNRKDIEDFLDNIKSYNPALRKESQWIPTRDAFRQLCQLALKGLDAQEYVNREGWRLVPITPTPAMYEAFNGVSMDMSVTPNQFKVGYEAMLAAAPKCEGDQG